MTNVLAFGIISSSQEFTRVHMPDPKKETVRIVLPTHRAVPLPPAQGSETAMINLTAKPVVPGGVVPPAPPLTIPSIKPPAAAGEPSKIPAVPALPKAPGVVPLAPAAPVVAIKPPAVAGEAPKIPAAPALPKAPGVVPLAPAAPAAAIKPPAAVSEAPQIPAAPVLPKAPGVAPAAPAVAIKPPASVAEAPQAPSPAVSITAISPKKVTAKISLPTAAKTIPQATMNLKKAAPAAAAPTEKKSAPAEADAANVAEGKAASFDLILGIAAAVVALASLGIQVWTILG